MALLRGCILMPPFGYSGPLCGRAPGGKASHPEGLIRTAPNLGIPAALCRVWAGPDLPVHRQSFHALCCQLGWLRIRRGVGRLWRARRKNARRIETRRNAATRIVPTSPSARSQPLTGTRAPRLNDTNRADQTPHSVWCVTVWSRQGAQIRLSYPDGTVSLHGRILKDSTLAGSRSTTGSRMSSILASRVGSSFTPAAVAVSISWSGRRQWLPRRWGFAVPRRRRGRPWTGRRPRRAV